MITKYTWQTIKPTEPGLYRTCLSNDKYHSARLWDGENWWDISGTRGDSAMPFTIPKRVSADVKPLLAWMRHYKSLALRKITDQGKVRWGVAYKHFEPAEVLAWLVKMGTLPADWKECYQEHMRAGVGK